MIEAKSNFRPDSVGHHYDSLDPFYRKIWGEHLHHGLWLTGKETTEEAIVQLIEWVATKARLGSGLKVCDVGCGYGGTLRYLQRSRSARGIGYTLSRAQHEYAQQCCPPGVMIVNQDWLDNSLTDETFDVVLSIESLSHIANKHRFFREAFRVLKPGGKLVICDWLSCEHPHPWLKQSLLEPICQEGRLAGLYPPQSYLELLEQTGFSQVEFKDISANVKKTWSVVARGLLRESLSDHDLRRFLRSQFNVDREFFWTPFRILLAYQTKCFIYGFFNAIKPDARAF